MNFSNSQCSAPGSRFVSFARPAMDLPTVRLAKIQSMQVKIQLIQAKI